MTITKTIKSLAKSLGYDIVKLKGNLGYGEPINELLKILSDVNVDCVLDIGACRGQFGQRLIDYNFSDTILSFEPISSMYKQLQQKAKKHDNWHVYERAAIGKDEGETSINISNLISNSSLLKIKSTNYSVNQSHYVANESVKQISLSTLNGNNLILKSKNTFIKMDVQGYEHIILEGMKHITYNVVGFYIELSLVKLYEGQQDYLYICQQLKSLGYDLVYIVPESIRNHRMIQFNGVFLHENFSY